jgi:hypothetical protein
MSTKKQNVTSYHVRKYLYTKGTKYHACGAARHKR